MTTEKAIYFEIRYKKRVTDYKAVARVYDNYLDKKITENNAREKYNNKGGINQFIREVIAKMNNDFTLEELGKIKKHFEHYHEYYTLYFNEDRVKFFGNYEECMGWFEEQNSKCGYCAITQEELHKIVKGRGGNLTLNKGKKRSKGTLEIERKDSTKVYDYDNCILACPLCNNAKSNLINEENWRDIFVEPMRQYYREVLGKS